MEAVMVAFIFTYSWSLDAPNNETKASFEATSAQQLVLRNSSGASELPYELASKVDFATNNHHDLQIDVPAIEVATSADFFNVSTSLRNPFYAYVTTHAP